MRPPKLLLLLSKRMLHRAMITNLRMLLLMWLVVTRLLFKHSPIHQIFFFFWRCLVCFWALNINFEPIFSMIICLCHCSFTLPWMVVLLSFYSSLHDFCLLDLQWPSPLRSWWSMFGKKLDFVKVLWLSHFHVICIFIRNFVTWLSDLHPFREFYRLAIFEVIYIHLRNLITWCTSV